ncbi:MAG: AAA family ATPase, partial [Planctomycetales bacterium]
MKLKLCPTQQQVFQRLLSGWPHGKLFVLLGRTGSGKTTLLRKLHRKQGGKLLTAGDYMKILAGRNPHAMEEAFEEMVLKAFENHDRVYLDDLHLLQDVLTEHCYYPRYGLLELPLTNIASFVTENDKKLIVVCDHCPPAPIHHRADVVSLPRFTPEDYEFFLRRSFDDDAMEGLDFEKIHRYVSSLNVYQFQQLARDHRESPPASTDAVVEYLRNQGLASNVDLEEVRRVDMDHLEGVDDLLKALDTHVVRPLEDDELAMKFQLKPKRGVLLLGPPGTGKTTVGRVLAHRLKGKFFLIDGTFISGGGDFYYRIQRVFNQAKENAPSVLFIDDSDAIFQSGEELGLYRYLLTMLDGVESESA